MRSRLYHSVERLAAAVLLVVLSPLLALLSLVLVLGQGRPIFFLQERSGLLGSTFTLYKFRTMGANTQAERHSDAVTPIGRFLRRFGLDELPQLLNILRGQMSFIGPRPALPSQVARYGPHERRRLETRPGITGWAQINGRNAISWEQRIALDVWYVENRTLRVDLRILMWTAVTLLSGRGVYGPGGSNPDFRGNDPAVADATREPCATS